MNILLVEDDVTVAELVSDIMERWGQSVTLADSGKAALIEAGRQPFDMALIDIMLPDGFGYDFLPEIKRRQPDLKIITMTGCSTPEMEKRARQQGIAYYMAKPVNIGELRDIVEHLSGKQSK